MMIDEVTFIEGFKSALYTSALKFHTEHLTQQEPKSRSLYISHYNTH